MKKHSDKNFKKFSKNAPKTFKTHQKIDKNIHKKPVKNLKKLRKIHQNLVGFFSNAKLQRNSRWPPKHKMV
jgi:Fe-S cluster biosynthesis and repair protein YggX